MNAYIVSGGSRNLSLSYMGGIPFRLISLAETAVSSVIPSRDHTSVRLPQEFNLVLLCSELYHNSRKSRGNERVSTRVPGTGRKYLVYLLLYVHGMQNVSVCPCMLEMTYEPDREAGLFSSSLSRTCSNRSTPGLYIVPDTVLWCAAAAAKGTNGHTCGAN